MVLFWLYFGANFWVRLWVNVFVTISSRYFYRVQKLFTLSSQTLDGLILIYRIEKCNGILLSSRFVIWLLSPTFEFSPQRVNAVQCDLFMDFCVTSDLIVYVIFLSTCADLIFYPFPCCSVCSLDRYVILPKHLPNAATRVINYSEFGCNPLLVCICQIKLLRLSI